MNRLLRAAAVALSMAVSSQALASAYVIDSFTDGLYFDAGNGLSQSDSVGNPLDGIYTYAGAYNRSATFVSTTPPSTAWFGADDEPGVQIANDPTANGTLTLNYDVSSLKSGLGNTGNSGLMFTVFGSDGEGRVSIEAKLNGASLGSWTSTSPVYFDTPASYQNGLFSFANSALTGTGDQLQLIVSGQTGYDVSFGPLSIDVLPVPEPSEWAMLIAGLGVVGAVASRRRTLAAA